LKKLITFQIFRREPPRDDVVEDILGPIPGLSAPRRVPLESFKALELPPREAFIEYLGRRYGKGTYEIAKCNGGRAKVDPGFPTVAIYVIL
jgi:hypothetical protein